MSGQGIIWKKVFLPEDRDLHSLPSDQNFLDFPETDTTIITITAKIIYPFSEKNSFPTILLVLTGKGSNDRSHTRGPGRPVNPIGPGGPFRAI